MENPEFKKQIAIMTKSYLNTVCLLVKELKANKSSAFINILVIVTGICLVITTGIILNDDYHRSEKTYRDKIDQTTATMNEMTQDYQRFIRILGHTSKIISIDQNKSNLLHTGYAEKEFSESLMDSLVGKVQLLDRLCPVLRKRLTLPAYNRTVFITGVGEEKSRSSHNSALLPMPKAGTVILGYEVHKPNKLKSGDYFSITDKKFVVAECLDTKGSREDISIFLNLSDAQDLFGSKNRINEILAVPLIVDGKRISREVKKFSGNRLDALLSRGKTLTRVKAIQSSLGVARKRIEQEKALLEEVRNKSIRTFITVTLSTLIVIMVWTGLTSYAEVRRKWKELAILFSIGIGPDEGAKLVIMRSGLVGFIGASAGVASAFPVSFLVLRNFHFGWQEISFALLTVVAAPLLCISASAWAAYQASKIEPARLLLKN